jgi:hypothetical protein
MGGGLLAESSMGPLPQVRPILVMPMAEGLRRLTREGEGTSVGAASLGPARVNLGTHIGTFTFFSKAPLWSH